jgi:hypothetical protein
MPGACAAQITYWLPVCSAVHIRGCKLSTPLTAQLTALTAGGAPAKTASIFVLSFCNEPVCFEA